MKRAVLFGLMLAACGGSPVIGTTGPVKEPFKALKAGACTQDSDCAVAKCPNACNQGVPYCSLPQVFRRDDIINACPCFEKGESGGCAKPPGDFCGAEPGCAGPFPGEPMVARCVSQKCELRFGDGGVPDAGG